MKKLCRNTMLVLGIVMLNCSFLNSSEYTKEASYPFIGADMQWVDSVFNTMTLDEKIGQLFMVAAYSDPKQDNEEAVKKLITESHIGGVIFFKGSPIRQAQMTNTFQSLAKIPLSVAIDGEWGLAMRLDSTIAFPRQLQLGAIDKKNEYLIEEMGREVGRECERIGIHINFAPVVDINNNPQNPVINTRSFGEEKENVARKSLLYMKGMQSHNILTTAKHFPGHGNTASDSHYTLPLIKGTKDEIDKFELYPFKQLIKNDLTGVMIAHLNVPSMEKTKNLPSTLSRKIVTEKLRDEMNFQGLIFTDALNMKAVVNAFPAGEVEVRALMAGNDVLEFTLDVPKAISAIKQAIVDGRITEAEVDEHCRRVLIAKSWMKVPERNHVEIANLYKDLNTPEARNLNRKLIQSSITVVKDSQSQLPFKKLDTKKFAVVSLKNGTSYFVNKLQKQTAVKQFVVPATNDYKTLEVVLPKTIQELKSYDVVILDVQGTSSYPSKKYGITQSMVDIVGRIAKENNVVMVLHANPYALDYFTTVLPDVESIVVSYDFKRIVQEITPEVLFGALPASGHLPVSVGGFSEGDGISTAAINRLRSGEPIEVGMNEDCLQKIDSVVQQFIDYGAFPGCEVLVAKNGVVVYDKPFGFYTYENKDSVTDNTIYDLASVTKVVATTVSLMKLYDEGRFSLEKTLGDYLPYLKETNKDTLLLKDVLTHQAQLRSGVGLTQSLFKNYYEKGMKSRTRSAEYPYMMESGLYLSSKMQYADNAISSKRDFEHQIEVGEGVYLNNAYRDTVMNLIVSSPLLPKKETVYSDLGFYLLSDVVKQISGESLDEYTMENFYSKLGATRLGYKPLERFSKTDIAPTETEEFFRCQLLQGYVHDRGAAMLGGVSGHAGVFSNAEDLAKLLQMLLNEGNYGGEQYIKPRTVELFTSCPYCDLGNRKGFGFDKPEPDTKKIDPTCRCTSPKSFGHTGFTGTMVWVDPEQSLVYIFLSNRVNRKTPDAKNTMLGDSAVRSRIQRIIYQAII